MYTVGSALRLHTVCNAGMTQRHTEGGSSLAKTNHDWMQGWPVRMWINEAYDKAYAEIFQDRYGVYCSEHPNTNAYSCMLTLF